MRANNMIYHFDIITEIQAPVEPGRKDVLVVG
jgi:hypothetical protein